MRIGIDASTIGTMGGPRTYVLNLINSLLKTDRENEYVIFYNSREHLGRFPQAKEIVVPFSNPFTRLIREHLLMPLFYKKERLDIIHNTKSAISIFKPCKTVVTLHDIIPLTNPETETFMARVYWSIQMPIAARRADRIITISEYAKKEISGYFGITSEKITVIPNCFEERFRPVSDTKALDEIRSKYTLPESFILYVGTIQPRKNLNMLIKAFYNLKKNGKINKKLVIAGRKGWLYSSLFKLIKELRIEEEVIFTGFVPDEDLPYVYNMAYLFVYLSLFEGFGIPPLEAMACGVPVICSNTTSIPEVVGDAGILVDPYDQKAVEDAIISVLSDQARQEELREKGLKQARKFSWERTAVETLNVYRELYDNQHRRLY